MFAGEKFNPDSLIPFSTYRPPRPDGKGFIWGVPEMSATVAHFYFSERMRGVDEDARRSTLILPSSSEARKAAQRVPATDKWIAARMQIVKSALWSQFRCIPSLAEGLLNGSIPIGSGQPLGHGWEARKRGDERWRHVVLKTAKQFLSGPRMVLLATGDTDIFNPFLFSARLDILLKQRRPAEMLISCRAGVDAMAEDWAIQNYVPAVHRSLRKTPGTSVLEDSIKALAEVATHAIFFTRGEDSTIRQLCARLALRRIPTRVIHLDKDGRQIQNRNASARPRPRP